MKRILLLLPSTGYRNDDFLAAAGNLGVHIAPAANYCHRVAPSRGFARIMTLHFDQPEAAAQTVLQEIGAKPDAVLAVDDSGVELAALLAERFGLPGNSAAAVRRVRDKLAFRRLLAEHEFPCPDFYHLRSTAELRGLQPEMEYPVVVKARRLSASRGVIRADDAELLERAVHRVRAIQRRADRDAEALGLVIEQFIPGREHALEGVLEHGALTTLALFDKPDPLDGPYFEETIYVTPSRLPDSVQRAIQEEVAPACRCAGLTHGPTHAAMRVNDRGIWLLEVAARSIGGLCGRVLTGFLGMSVEELILRQAVGEPLTLASAGGAAGAMMIPIPLRGIYQGAEGLAAARSVPGVTAISLTAEPGQIIAPPPDGASYLGFIFSRTAHAAEAEDALRRAHRLLRFDIRADYPASTAPATAIT